MPSRRRPGFTLLELLVVIAVIAVLISLLVPTMVRARDHALELRCMSNLRQLANGFIGYTLDNHGSMPSSDTSGPLNPGDPDHLGWVDGMSEPVSITSGSLYKYVGSTEVYHCPSDYREGANRSYSMNMFLASANSSAMSKYVVQRITQIPRASQIVAFVENPDPNVIWKNGPFIQFPTAEVDESTSWAWVDVVPSWHRKGANFAYADGHVEHWTWANPQTLSLLSRDSKMQARLPYYLTPNNPDLVRLRNAMVNWGPHN